MRSAVENSVQVRPVASVRGRVAAAETDDDVRVRPLRVTWHGPQLRAVRVGRAEQCLDVDGGERSKAGICRWRSEPGLQLHIPARLPTAWHDKAHPSAPL